MFPKYKVWLELDKKKLNYNFQKIKKQLDVKTKLFSVVKSNAYGHGLITFSKLADEIGVDGFCVDSMVEGIKLRQNNIKKSIIVLGITLPNIFKSALENNLTITISSWHFLRFLKKQCPRLPFHLKIDTGMHRQGVYVNDLPKILSFIKKNKLRLTGFYSHLAMPENRIFSEDQRLEFKRAEEIISDYRFKDLTRHLVATRGIQLGEDFYFDLVRVGMGLYGCLPEFKQILSWRTIITEIKDLKKGDPVGYDLTEKVNRSSKMAVLPIGYWHGFDRGLSKIGEVIIKNKKARVLGRVSMDVLAVDVSNINCRVGDQAVILGSAAEMAEKIGTTAYEIVTRINPLIKKIVV
jgi:alanine racemase